MRKLLLCAALLAPTPGLADGYVMGAGRWTCEKVITVVDEKQANEFYQLAGWILGFWSRESLGREAAFNDMLEKQGGTTIVDFTVATCRKVAPETLVYQLTQDIIKASN